MGTPYFFLLRAITPTTISTMRVVAAPTGRVRSLRAAAATALATWTSTIRATLVGTSSAVAAGNLSVQFVSSVLR